MKPQYPLSVGPTGRYLVDSDGIPTLVNGEAAWSLAVSLAREDAELYLDDRSARGVNALKVNLVERLWAPDAPRNAYGVEPFTEPGNFATPNPEYFAHIDWLIGQAAQRAIVVVAFPCYLGYPDPQPKGVNPGGQIEGWYHEIVESGVDACEHYGQFLGARYADTPNLLWVVGGDRNPGSVAPHLTAFVRGLRQGGSQHLCTAHVFPECPAADFYGDDSWIDVHLTYTYGIVHAQVLRDYDRRPIRPVMLIESTYEHEHNASDVQIRRQAWWALLSGACGQFVGNFPLWSLQGDWKRELHSPATVAMSHLKRFFDSFPWWQLVPDQSNELLTAGIGELRGLDTCCAAITEDKTLAVVYMPSPREIALDLSQLSGRNIRVAWLDPREGGKHDLGTITKGGTQSFVPPIGQDWVLIAQSLES